MDEIRFAIAQLVLALQVEGMRHPLAIVMATDDDHATFLALSGGAGLIEEVAITGPSHRAPYSARTQAEPS